MSARFLTKEHAPAVARIALGLVFFLFGIDQLLHPILWTAWIPDWTSIMLPAEKIVMLNGVLDLTLGTLLLLGLFTRLVAAIAVLHLAGIVATVGYNDIGIRDLGFLILAISIFLNGPDLWSLDHKYRKKF